MRVIATILSLLSLLAACANKARTIPLDSAATFAVHQENREFVVDRPEAEPPATVSAAELFRTPGAPTWALRKNGATLGAYWIDGVAGTTARAGVRSSDRELGTVRPSWDDNAIRLQIASADGATFQSDVFARLEPGAGPYALSRSAQTILDLRGRYQATLRDAQGAEVGWLRLRIGPYEPAARIYEARLPPGIGDDLAVAAVVSLADEIDWIETRTLNVYQGDKGPLIQSIPLPVH